MDIALAHTFGRVLVSNAIDRLRSVRTLVAASALAILSTIFGTSVGAGGASIDFGLSLLCLIAAYLWVAEARLLVGCAYLHFRRGVIVEAHSSKAAISMKWKRSNGTTLLIVAARAGQAGRFARFELINAACAGVEGTLLLRVASRSERSEVLHQVPGMRPLSSHLLEATGLSGAGLESLGREGLPRVVASAVRSFAGDSTRVGGVVAVTGSWGAGKSWVLERLTGELECAHPDRLHVRTVKFNPWLYSDEASLFAGFAKVLAHEAPTRRARSRLVQALKVIGPAAKFGPVDLTGVAEKIAGASEAGSEDARAVTREVAKSIRKRGPLCIIIDDVDRLTTDELLTLFKLVRLLGSVPGLNYVMAFDEQLILSLLTRTSFAMDSPVRARAFLEKVVERKISVPPFTSAQARSRVIDPLMSFPAVHGLQVRDGSIARMEVVLSILLVPELITIRAADRLVDEAQSLAMELYAEVDWGDWVLVAWVRVFAPSLWIWVVENRDDLVGSGQRFSPLSERPPLEGAEILKMLGFSPPMTFILQDLLEALFPRIRRTSSNIFVPHSSDEETIRRQGIGVKGYFDRYVWGTLPPGQLPDMRIVRELRAISCDSTGALRNFAGLQELLDGDTDAVEEMIGSNDGDPDIDWVAVLEFLRLNSLSDGGSREVNRFLMRSLATRSFYAFDDGFRRRLMAQAELHPSSWWDLLSGVRIKELPSELADWTGSLELLREGAIAELTALIKVGDVPNFSDMAALQSYWDLRHIDLSMANRLLVEQVDGGKWAPVDAVGVLVKVFGTAPNLQLGGLPIDEVVAVFGAERLIRYVQDLEDMPRLRDYWYKGHSYESVAASRESLREITVGGLLQWKYLAAPKGRKSESGDLSDEHAAPLRDLDGSR